MYAGRCTLALAGAAALCALSLVGSASARTLTTKATQDASYSDPTGDSKSAPDVGAVLASLDSGSGALAFAIQLANNDDLSNAGVLLAFDTDHNAATGNQLGAEYEIFVTQNAWVFLKWDGSQMSPFSHQPVVIVRSGSTLGIALCSCDLGTQSFDFGLGAIRGNDVDVAPDTGTWSFPQASKPSISFDSILVSQNPLMPKAGKRFTVSVTGAKLGTGEVVSPDSYSCTAKLAGHALKGSGTGGCSWALAKKARGKKLVVDVTISYQGASDMFEATYRVR
jgi:hypothetical protein